jgi:molybdenum cofactor biosynthesis enzyme
MKIEAEKGDSICAAARKAIMQAKNHSAEVRLTFNEIELTVSPLSFDIDIATIYSLKSEIRRLKRNRQVDLNNY